MAGQLESGVDQMLERAKGAGEIREGLTTREVMGLIMGVCQAGEHSELDGASRVRMLDVVCDGLRPPAVVSPSDPPA